MEELHKIVKKKQEDFDITSQYLGQVVKDNNITRKRTRYDHYPKERYGIQQVYIRCVVKTDDNYVFRKFTLLCAISNSKCVGMTKERFVEFLEANIFNKYKKISYNFR